MEIPGDESVRSLRFGSRYPPRKGLGTGISGYIVSMKTVSSVDEAIAHINRYNTGHSETIVADSYENAPRSSWICVGRGLRLPSAPPPGSADGFEFGFGAEIGISTPKRFAPGARAGFWL
ncbi:MAG: hypothetical protein ACLRT5_07170 [Lachnospiraceae bacterium]